MGRTHKVWDGTISYDEFYIAAKALCERWKEIDSSLPQWIWIPSRREDGYLSLENVHHLSSNEEPVVEQGLSEVEELVDSATLVKCANDEAHIYNFHIVYSFSYSVPVLYFRGYRCDGQPLDLDSIQKDLPDYSLSLLKESKWTFMTQEEHPFLHCPWYTLHPCGTSEWMKLLHGDNQKRNLTDVQYLPSWLSMVGQAVGLRIPLNLHTEALQKSITSTNVG